MVTATKAPLASAGPSPSWYRGPSVPDTPWHRELGISGMPYPDGYVKSPLRFYLTTHKQGWLWREDTEVPLFVSHRRLLDAAHLHPATVPWALDSGAFSEVAMFGRHTTSPAEYCAAVARYDREIGQLEWAAPQDMMCEPEIIRGGTLNGLRIPGTGLSLRQHQEMTIANFRLLESMWPEYSDAECPFMPVLQGWDPDDYLRCADMYDAAGVRLEDYPVVGLGSVCRRNSPRELLRVLDSVIPRLTPWPALHGFGMKATGLEAAGHLMTTADSMAWSDKARKERIVLPGHSHGHCGNCIAYARQWRAEMLAKVGLAQAA